MGREPSGEAVKARVKRLSERVGDDDAELLGQLRMGLSVAHACEQSDAWDMESQPWREKIAALAKEYNIDLSDITESGVQDGKHRDGYLWSQIQKGRDEADPDGSVTEGLRAPADGFDDGYPKVEALGPVGVITTAGNPLPASDG